MVYRTRVTGEITITPPLTWKEIQNSSFFYPDPDREVMLAHTVEKIETDEGELLRRTASALIPRSLCAFQTVHLVEQVQATIDEFPDHVFTGRFDCEGDTHTDLWRVTIRDGRATRVEPRIVWPDEGAEVAGVGASAGRELVESHHPDNIEKAAYDRAIEAVRDEYLHDDTGTPEDEAYNQGINDAVAAIRNLKE